MLFENFSKSMAGRTKQEMSLSKFLDTDSKVEVILDFYFNKLTERKKQIVKKKIINRIDSYSISLDEIYNLVLLANKTKSRHLLLYYRVWKFFKNDYGNGGINFTIPSRDKYDGGFERFENDYNLKQCLKETHI